MEWELLQTIEERCGDAEYYYSAQRAMNDLDLIERFHLQPADLDAYRMELALAAAHEISRLDRQARQQAQKQNG